MHTHILVPTSNFKNLILYIPSQYGYSLLKLGPFKLYSREQVHLTSLEATFIFLYSTFNTTYIRFPVHPIILGTCLNIMSLMLSLLHMLKYLRNSFVESLKVKYDT